MELICSICYYNREIDLRAVNSSMIVYLQMIETDEDKSKFEEIYQEYRNLMYYVASRFFYCPEVPFTLYRTLYKLRTFVMKPSICIPPICELQPESIFSRCRFNLLRDANSPASR